MKALLRWGYWGLWFYLSCHCILVVRAEETGSPDPVMKLGIFYPPISDSASRADVAVSFSLWMREQAASVGVRAADVMLFDSIDDMSTAFESGTINLISAPPLTIALHFKRDNLADGVIGLRAPGKLNSVIVVARTDKKIKSIHDMRGKRLIMPDNHELADIFLDTLVLKSEHVAYKRYFSLITIEKKDKRILLNLFFDKADVAVVNESAYELMKELNPQFNEKTTVISSYPTKSKSYMYVNKQSPFRHKLIDNYMRISSSERGRQFLNLFQQQVLEVCSVQELDAYDELYREHGLLLKKYRIKH